MTGPGSLEILAVEKAENRKADPRQDGKPHPAKGAGIRGDKRLEWRT